LIYQNPANPQSWNLYSYVRNNPLRFVDAFGRKCVNLDGGGVGDDGTDPVCDDLSIRVSVSISGISDFRDFRDSLRNSSKTGGMTNAHREFRSLSPPKRNPRYGTLS
jgi:hypothetical protein